uniref:Akirin 1 n=1 Tax=Equus caballus TaxID=9796 RepID=A0A9L0RN97_HORSE
EKGTGVPLGLGASGDRRHPGGVVGPQCGFSVFPELGRLEGWGARGRWEYPWPLGAPRSPKTPPPRLCGPALSRPADPVGLGKLDSPHEPGLEEQIFQNIKQEYSRYQRWRHLEVVLNQSEACTSESQPHSAALAAPSSPGSSWMKKDQPTFTLRQVGIICERLLKDYEDKIREEYEQILNTKLAEQYESFVKFTHDQIMRRYGTRPTSYVS